MQSKSKFKLVDMIFGPWKKARPKRSNSMGMGTKCSLVKMPKMMMLRRSRSWPAGGMMNGSMPQEEEHGGDSLLATNTKKRCKKQGCLAVYVGEERRRFVIETETVNHPLFKRLLDEAEREYGFDSEGPLTLPCEVPIFCAVLSQILTPATPPRMYRPATSPFLPQHIIRSN